MTHTHKKSGKCPSDDELKWFGRPEPPLLEIRRIFSHIMDCDKCRMKWLIGLDPPSMPDSVTAGHFGLHLGFKLAWRALGQARIEIFLIRVPERGTDLWKKFLASQVGRKNRRGFRHFVDELTQ